MPWKRTSGDDLAKVVEIAAGRTILCSPFITRFGLDVVRGAMRSEIQELEVWTRLRLEDYVVGATDPDALLEFFRELPDNMDKKLFVSDHLHAKFILADDRAALVGSSNLTRGGIERNIELNRVIEGEDVRELLEYISDIRPTLSPTGLQYLERFTTEANSRARDREALIEIIGEVAEPPEGQKPLIPLREFIRHTEELDGRVPDEIKTIFYNLDENNRTGHLKQGFYAVQRFFQEHPQHVSKVAEAGLDEAFDIAGTELEADWTRFCEEYGDESDNLLRYDMSILLGTYLTSRYGGTRMGGGGGDYPFKLVWVPVARMMVDQ